MRPAIPYLAVCVLALSAAASEPSPEDWRVSRHEWTGEVAAGTAVTIANPHGDVRVRAGTAGEVYLLAVIQRHADDPRRAEVAPEPGDGELRLEVRIPEAAAGAAGGTAPGEIPEAWARRRVDLTVFVPPGAATRARTSRGLVELRGLTGDVEAASETGDVKLRTAGAVKVHTRHGDVLAQPRRSDWAGTSEIETLTGDIRVELPRGGEADVELETRGEITTDYSIEIRRPGDGPLKRGLATIGEAGGRLVLKSHRGAIRLVESTVPEQAAPAEAAGAETPQTEKPSHPDSTEE